MAERFSPPILWEILSARRKSPISWSAQFYRFSLKKTTGPDGTVRCSVLSPRLLPTVTHYDAGKSNVRTYLFRDYTEAITKAHGVRQAYPDFSLEMIQSIARENIDPEFLQLT